MTETVPCPFCESGISPTAKKCRHCGEWIRRECLSCGTPIKNQWAARGLCAECETKSPGGVGLPAAPGSGVVRSDPRSSQVPAYDWPRKSRTTSVGLALVLGGFGAHKIYLDKPGKALVYTLFSWTGIPTIIGIVEAVKYIRMDEEEFQRRFLAGDL